MGFVFDRSWLVLLSEYLIKSSVILSVSILLVVVLRKKSAGLRHLVLSFFLIGLLFLPILSIISTGWETKFLPSWQTEDAAVLDADGRTANLDDSSRTSASTSMASELPRPMEEGQKDFRFSLSMFLKKLKPACKFAAMVLWFFGWMFLSIRMAMGLYGTIRLAREGQVIQDPLWRRLLYRFLRAVSLRRKINLLSHDKVLVPLTWGVVKPIVMMPAESEIWSENQRSAALYHELSHIKRGDYLVMLLARISRAVFWFNPLSWIVLGMIKREQEKACDEHVLRAGIKPSTYAENLLLIRNSALDHWNPPAAVLGAMNKSHLNDRLSTILKQRFILKEAQMKTKVSLSVLAVLSISFIGLARPGNTFSSHVEAVSHETAAIAAWIDSHETPVDAQQQEKKEQKKEVKKGVKIEEKDKKEQKKELKISHAYKIRSKEIHLDHAEGHSAAAIMDDKGVFTFIYTAEFAIDQKEAFEKAVKKLEDNLPEDYSLDSTFDEGEGTLILKIKKEKKEGEEYKKAVISLDEIKELIEEFKKDIEKIKK